MKSIPDYSCRFRILKGGKISLVVSALLVGSSLVGADYTVNGVNNNYKSKYSNDGTNVPILGAGFTEDTAKINLGASINNTDSDYFSGFEVGTIDYFSTFWNAGTINAPIQV